MATLAETIFDISTQHLRAGGLLLGQNIESVQGVNGTVPVDEPGCQIMPTCELGGMGLSVGAALSGRPVIHVTRFASFMHMQCAALIHFAGKANALWGYNIPLFVRIVSGDGLGPVHSGTTHNLFCHVPGLTVCAPCTSREYIAVWRAFVDAKTPFVVSEHRSTYAEGEVSLFVIQDSAAQVLLIGISSARASMLKAAESLRAQGIGSDFCPLVWLNPFSVDEIHTVMDLARKTKRVVIADCAYEPCSVAEHLAYRIFTETGAKVRVVGMEPRLSGVAAHLENSTPTPDRIVQAVKEML